jgi:alkanesulfonate monooxygenase SsuD/methylene tetrahydromethanopterin reductase-like flavin-dependent oxidoreductase (luciferase family)
MSPRLIETTGVEVSDRMAIMATWIDAAANDFRHQAKMFELEPAALDDTPDPKPLPPSLTLAETEVSLALARRQINSMATVLCEALNHVSDAALIQKINAVTDGI